jgi:hypothetical protein
MSHRYLDATVFKDAGISVTKCILYVKHWMADCPVSRRKYKMLTVISAILCLILDKELASFRLYLLRTLRRFVEHLLQVDIFRKHASLISGELSRIVVCILEVNNNAQTAFFNVCTARQDEKSIDTAQDEGDSYWMMLKSNRTRASLNALWVCSKDHAMVPSTPEYFVRELSAKTGTCDKAMSQNDWCWNESIWKCGSSYEDWIKDLVCSIIICYYNKAVTPSSAFFSICIGVCAIEHSFAEFLFPAIIFDLLSHGGFRGEYTAKKVGASVRDEVLHESMIGPSQSLVNSRLSHLFYQALLRAQTANQVKSVSLLVDTLLFLLHETSQPPISNREMIPTIIQDLNRLLYGEVYLMVLCYI